MSFTGFVGSSIHEGTCQLKQSLRQSSTDDLTRPTHASFTRLVPKFFRVRKHVKCTNTLWISDVISKLLLIQSHPHAPRKHGSAYSISKLVFLKRQTVPGRSRKRERQRHCRWVSWLSSTEFFSRTREEFSKGSRKKSTGMGKRTDQISRSKKGGIESILIRQQILG